jgi:hypothetical protein
MRRAPDWIVGTAGVNLPTVEAIKLDVTRSLLAIASSRIATRTKIYKIFIAVVNRAMTTRS